MGALGDSMAAKLQVTEKERSKEGCNYKYVTAVITIHCNYTWQSALTDGGTTS